MGFIIRKHRHFYRKFLLLIITGWLYLFNPSEIVKAQVVLGAREIAMGQATTALPGSGWAIFSNPAMMPGDRSTASFFAVRYYGLSEISDIAASVSYPTRIGVLAAGVHRYGYDLFNESRLRAGYKHSVLGFHFGAVANYSHVMQGGGYGSAGALGIDVGLAAPIIPELWIAAKATNLNQPTYGSRNKEELPRDLSAGLSYLLSHKALLSAEVYKDVRFPIAFRGGVEVTVMGGLLGRAGVTSAPQTFSAGFGYETSHWGFNIVVQRHENILLGYSPAADFNISW